MALECPKCGYALTKARSTSDHRRLFALIFAAFDNWPETHSFQPADSEHLRAWILCQIGYRETITIPVTSDDPRIARLAALTAEAAFRAVPSNSFARVMGDALVIEHPKSINFATLDQKQFGPLREAIELLIETETGIDIDGCLRETG